MESAPKCGFASFDGLQSVPVKNSFRCAGLSKNGSASLVMKNIMNTTASVGTAVIHSKPALPRRPATAFAASVRASIIRLFFLFSMETPPRGCYSQTGMYPRSETISLPSFERWSVTKLYTAEPIFG